MVVGISYVLASGIHVPAIVAQYMHAFGLYALMGLLLDSTGAAAKPLFGMTLARHFDQPYISKSIREFWGKRWNLVAGSALRSLVYDPIVEGRLLSHCLPCCAEEVGSLMMFQVPLALAAVPSCVAHCLV